MVLSLFRRFICRFLYVASFTCWVILADITAGASDWPVLFRRHGRHRRRRRWASLRCGTHRARNSAQGYTAIPATSCTASCPVLSVCLRSCTSADETPLGSPRPPHPLEVAATFLPQISDRVNCPFSPFLLIIS